MNQAALTLLGGTLEGGSRDVPADLLSPCRTYQDALKVGMRLDPARRTWGAIADALGIDSGQWSRILNCDLRGGTKAKFLNPAKYSLFEQTVQNNALSKFFRMESEGLLNHQNVSKEQRRAQLLAELEALERA